MLLIYTIRDLLTRLSVVIIIIKTTLLQVYGGKCTCIYYYIYGSGQNICINLNNRVSAVLGFSLKPQFKPNLTVYRMVRL